MEPSAILPTSPAQPVAFSGVCPVCHQPVLPTYFFCPNCGTGLRSSPLPTSPEAQTWLYLHSIILPSLLFITISKWKGYKYFKSDDPKARQVGNVAILLLALSTFFTFYLAYTWTTQTIQSSINSVNASMNF